MARTYDMRKRERAAAGTRAAILAAAHGLLNRADGGGLTLQEVADAAGVSRVTIYNSIGSRRDLLAAVFEDQGRLIEFDRVLVAMQQPDAGRAVTDTVVESCRAWSVIPGAIRRTQALAVLDPEVGDLVERYERYRRAELEGLARRAVSAGVSGAGVSVDRATGVLVVLTGFAAYDALRMDHDAESATAQLVAMVTASLGMYTAGR